MTTTDEDYARVLRARVEAVLPALDVDVHHVVPRARRRRRAVRGAGVTGVLVVALGAGWLVVGDRGHDEALPAGPAPVLGSVGRVPVVALDGTVTGVPGDPWDGDAPYWYVVVEQVAGGDELPAQDAAFGEHVERVESWLSRERPGLIVVDGDLEHALGIGPSDVVGEFLVGSGHAPVSDPEVLPTDPRGLAAVLGVRLGSAHDVDDARFSGVLDGLHRGGLLERPLREAYWQVAAALPGVEVSDGRDTRGRPGQVLRRTTAQGEDVVVVRDPATGLLLEVRSSQRWAVYLEQHVADGTPVPPSLEPLRCTDWATCSR